MIPAWLLAKQGGILRAASLNTCRCGAPLLQGLDADRAALTAIVDIQPIDEIGEAVALVQGRRTYDLVGGYQRKELEYRYEWNIKKKRRYPVLAEHRCGQPLHHHATPTLETERTPADENPPF